MDRPGEELVGEIAGEGRGASTSLSMTTEPLEVILSEASDSRAQPKQPTSTTRRSSPPLPQGFRKPAARFAAGHRG
jgi:hypothetical protein